MPPAHGEWLASRLPAATLHMLPGGGHISMYERNYGAVLDQLIAVSA